MTKKSIYYVILTSLMVLMTSSIFIINTKAHAPEGMTLSFDLNAQMLNVTIYHDVNDPNVHYVDRVIVTVNGSEVQDSFYSSQPTTAGGLYQYSITANNASTIRAIARCSEGGNVAACIIVGVGPCPLGGGPGIPGFFGLWLIIGFSIIVSLGIIYKKIRY
ncbi:MAG: hypothetical protein ACXAAH_13100 [Promethearchaeota archaeon]|jgi:hypothetical protein